jgi:3'(2'), 5'-bisphosphate nucleotidase
VLICVLNIASHFVGCATGLLDHVTVLVGIAVNGKAVAGVIYQPYYNYKAGPDAPLGRIIWGIVGLGK